MLGTQVKFSADRQTPVKQYAPDLSMWGHKNQFQIQSGKREKRVGNL